MTSEASAQKIVVIGGGTGSFTLLSSLKDCFADITALVNMVDDGGSTGVLRDELGVLPPGDVRQCLVALSDAPDTLRRLFNFRFAQGTFAGHSFGNIFLSAMERMTDSFDQAVEMTSEVLQISGRVLPMTIDNCRLHMRVGDEEFRGESKVGDATIPPGVRPKLWIQPPAKITPAARDALRTADIIVIAPGNLYCSLVPSLLVNGVGDTIKESRAQLVYVANLVNKPNHTAHFGVHDYVVELERFMSGRKIDTVLYNNDEPPHWLLKRYALEGEFPVLVDESRLDSAHYEAIGGRYLQKGDVERAKNDTRIKRSYIRHDGDAIARQLRELVA